MHGHGNMHRCIFWYNRRMLKSFLKRSLPLPFYFECEENEMGGRDQNEKTNTWIVDFGHRVWHLLSSWRKKSDWHRPNVFKSEWNTWLERKWKLRWLKRSTERVENGRFVNVSEQNRCDSRKTTHTNGGFLSPLRIYTRTRYCDNCHDSCTCLCGGNAPRVFFSVLAMKRQTIYWWRLITTTTTGVTTGAPLFSVASTHHMSTLVWFRSWFPYVNE